VVGVFIIATREAIPTKSTELTEKASVPDGAQGIAGACGTPTNGTKARVVAQFSTFQHNRRLIAVILLPVNELAINLSPKRIYHRYLKVLVVAEALVAEVLGNFFAMPNRFCICLELDPNYISMRDAILHVEEKLLHAITSEDQSDVSGLVPNVSLQPIPLFCGADQRRP
jgi:hypothetical protein